MSVFILSCGIIDRPALIRVKTSKKEDGTFLAGCRFVIQEKVCVVGSYS